jgi:cell division protein FtsI (penicillin-binding protein 3)
LIVVVAPPARKGRTGDARQALVATAQIRLMILSILFGFGMLVVVGKLALLAIWAEPATARDIATTLVPPRGDIVDSNGAPLARTIDAWSIAIHPNQVIGDKAARQAARRPDPRAERRALLCNSQFGQRLRLPEAPRCPSW